MTEQTSGSVPKFEVKPRLPPADNFPVMSELQTDVIAVAVPGTMERERKEMLSIPSGLAFSDQELAAITEDIRKVEFSPYLLKWIEAYESAGQRGRFLWQWCLRGVDLTTLPCVLPELRQHVIETKMLSILFGTLIDDIADREQDREMLEMAISMASDDWSEERLELWDSRRRTGLEVIARIWSEVWSRCKIYPRFVEYEQLLRFDNAQILNAMRFALLVNQRPSLLNVLEHDLYQPHNMQIMFMPSLDLTASPAFNLDDLGHAREVFWHAQRMGRIGNMITTWEREVLDRDFTSGIFAHAIHNKVLNADDLRNLPAHEIMSLLESAECQEQFVREWTHHRDQMALKIRNVRSVDLSPYLQGFQELIKFHLGSRGLV